MSSARLLKHFDLGWVIFWVVMLPISIFTGLWKRVEYVTFLSLWALVVTHWGSWKASRAEVKVEEAQQVTGGDVTVQNAGHVDGPRS
jgi:hypothetical protein